MQKNNLIVKREFLKSNWAETDFNNSDMSKKLPFPAQQKPIKENQNKIELLNKEKWQPVVVDLIKLIFERKSIRKYSDEKISFEEISKLLFCTQGIKKHLEGYSFRTVPSGGARHPFETYFYANKVENLEKGIYRYLPLDNSIVLEIPYYDGIENDIHKATLEQFWNPAIYFFWSVIPYRTEYKYIDAAAKLAALDIGHVCQNLYLVAEAIGCGVCAIGAYDQKAMDKLLKLDGNDEFIIYCASVGKKI